MTFKQNKYTKIYFSLVEKCRNRISREMFYEKHHIIPKSMGGRNTKENLVLMTPKEHYVAHHLLTKMCNGVYATKMNYAFWKMNIRLKKMGNIRINLKTYEEIRRKQQENMSRTMSGRVVSESAREAVRRSNKLRTGEKHPLFGTKRPEHVIEAGRKANLGNKYCVGRIASKETRERLSLAQKKREKFNCVVCGKQISGPGNLKMHTQAHERKKQIA